jgi:hypothetical protein
MLDEVLYEQMEDCVIGCGDGSSHVRRSMIFDFLVSQKMGILQQIVS